VPVESLPKTAALIRSVEKKLGSEGRVLVRYSGTENLLRVMIEGPTKGVVGAYARDISRTAAGEISAHG
jgi:phosphoglucosamine mutase